MPTEPHATGNQGATHFGSRENPVNGKTEISITGTLGAKIISCEFENYSACRFLVRREHARATGEAVIHAWRQKYWKSCSSISENAFENWTGPDPELTPRSGQSLRLIRLRQPLRVETADKKI